MMASVRPKATTTAASRQARRCTRPDTAWWSGRAPAMAITIADIHSRRAVTAAGGIWANNLAASPAPNWTEKMPVTTSTDGGTTVHSAHWFAGPRFHDPEGLSCVSRLSRDRAAWVLWPGGTGLLVAGTACHSSSGHAEAIDQPDPALDRRRRRRWPGCQRPARLARWIFCPAREPPRHGCGRAWTSRGRRRSARHGRRCGAGTSPWAPAPPPPDGQIVYSARNRVNDGKGPAGEIFGSALAHAETNVLARLPFRHLQDLILTTTLQPCLQCAAAIRLGPIAAVPFAGPDRYWDGCHEFGKLSAREARKAQPARTGPRRDELGTFATLISRFGATLTPAFEEVLRTLGKGR